jgi:hypothetical protein
MYSAIVSGVWSNSNYDTEDHARTSILDEMRLKYEDAIDELYGAPRPTDDELAANPFFAPAMRPLQLDSESDQASAEVIQLYGEDVDQVG